ncbi:MAG: M13 family metallopeptidase, partial [Planctomycetota bacterium]
MRRFFRITLSATFVALLASTPQLTIGQDVELDTSAFDREIRPQDDLFLFVNGTWLQNTEIPADKSNYGSFIQLADLSQSRIRTLLDEVAAGQHEPGSTAQKVGDFYKAFLDEAGICDELGMSPVEDHVAKAKTLSSHADVFRFMGELQTMGVSTPVGFFIAQDPKESTQYQVQIVQTGLSLPDRDYYLEDNERFEAARAAMAQYIEKLFELAAIEGGSDAAANILALETRLAEAHWAREIIRQADKRYNKFTRDELGTLTPELDWNAFFDSAGVGEFDELNVMTPSYFEALNAIVVETPVETWVQYFQFQMLDGASPLLSEPFVMAHFNFHDKALAGIEELKERWKRAVEATAGAGAGDFGALGEAVGELYVQRHFPPEYKAQMQELVDNLLAAFGQSIDELEWMTDETKVRAKEKLAKINTKIGYPDRWRDYSSVEVKADDLFGNVVRATTFEYNRMLNKLGQPVDRDEWGMTPHTVNAYYNSSLNEIVFPAAILQPPFFSPDAPAPLNYGGIGAVIGHEISHAFDDQGSKSDGDGNLNNWWTDADREAFDELGGRLSAQFDEYEPLPGKFVNGNFTLGENIGDLSGLAIAYKAMKLAGLEISDDELYGFSEDQLFFV